MLNVSYLGCIHAWHFQDICQLVQLLLRHFSFVNHDGIVHVTAFDEVRFEQRDDVSDEDKSTGRRDFCRIIIDIIECRKLTIDEF